MGARSVSRTDPLRRAEGSEKPVLVCSTIPGLMEAELITLVFFAEEGEPVHLGTINLEDRQQAGGPVNCEPNRESY